MDTLSSRGISGECERADCQHHVPSEMTGIEMWVLRRGGAGKGRKLRNKVS